MSNIRQTGVIIVDKSAIRYHVMQQPRSIPTTIPSLIYYMENSWCYIELTIIVMFVLTLLVSAEMHDRDSFNNYCKRGSGIVIGEMSNKDHVIGNILKIQDIILNPRTYLPLNVGLYFR